MIPDNYLDLRFNPATAGLPFLPPAPPQAADWDGFRPLTDEQWQWTAFRLPRDGKNDGAFPRCGRPRLPDRQCFEALLWLAWHRAPWRELPTRYGCHKVVQRRLRAWTSGRTFSRMWADYLDLLTLEEIDAWKTRLLSGRGRGLARQLMISVAGRA